jgi:hypothetical protein
MEPRRMFADYQSQDSSVSSDSLSAMGKSIPYKKHNAQRLAITAVLRLGASEKLGSIVQVAVTRSPKYPSP